MTIGENDKANSKLLLFAALHAGDRTEFKLHLKKVLAEMFDQSKEGHADAALANKRIAEKLDSMLS